MATTQLPVQGRDMPERPRSPSARPGTRRTTSGHGHEAPHVALGLLVAAIVGWALLAPLPFVVSLANDLWWQPWWAKTMPIVWPPLGLVLLELFMMALVGLPLALLFCFAAGTPAWFVARRRGLRRGRDAAWVGAIVGIGLDVVLALPIVVFEAPPHAEPWTRISLFHASVGLYIAAVGAVAGVAARRASGTKSTDRADMARVFA